MPEFGFRVCSTSVSSGYTSECGEEGHEAEQYSIFGRDRNGKLNAFPASCVMIDGEPRISELKRETAANLDVVGSSGRTLRQ